MGRREVTFNDMRDPETRAHMGRAVVEIYDSCVYTEKVFGDFNATDHIEWFVALLRKGGVSSD